jgi:diguanylate cyclase (GGDEF)-like protein
MPGAQLKARLNQSGGHMKRDRLETSLEGIRHLLSHLHGEVTALEESYSQVLSVLRRFEGAADFDDLTGLLRRRAFFQKWQLLLDECQRLNENCGVLMIDIDHFKKVNDTHGHPTGDEVIKRVSSLLKQYESPHCIVSRFGGEEFAVVVKGTDAEVLGVAEFIRRGAEKLHGPVIGSDGTPSSTVEWKCTLSVGMASTRKEGFDATRLLKLADEALYESKKKGRNRVSAA